MPYSIESRLEVEIIMAASSGRSSISHESLSISSKSQEHDGPYAVLLLYFLLIVVSF